LLNIRDAEHLATAWQELHANIARHRPGLTLDGVLIEKMSPPGIELIVGGRNDPEWGPVLLVGIGGIYAEVLHDVRHLPPDLDVPANMRELDQLKCSPLLHGFRGTAPTDTTAAAIIIEKISGLLRAEPTIREIDLNPVIVYPNGQGAVALDALMLVTS